MHASAPDGNNWIIVRAANFIGAAGLALLVYLSGHTGMGGGAVEKRPPQPS